MILLKNVLKILNNIANFNLAESWDNSGHLIGSLNSEIRKILITVELTQKVLNEAIEKKVDLIITHHPVIFSGMKRIIKENDNIIYTCIRKEINVISMHTNYDIEHAYAFFPEKLKNICENPKPFSITTKEELYKLVVYVPETSAEEVKEAMFEKGAGHIGNYSHCSFNMAGDGQFKPCEGSNPAIGNHGELETVNEIRIETVVRSKDISSVISAMLKAHPYEEVAYDLFKKRETGEKKGYGIVANLKESMFFEELFKVLSKDYPLARATGDKNTKIKKIAFCNGSGASFINKAASMNIDLYITGDVKYHDGVEAWKKRMNMLDLGHYETEQIFCEHILKRLNNIEELKEIELIKSDQDSPVFWRI